MKLEKGQVYLFTNNHGAEAYLKIMEAREQEAVAVRVQKVDIRTLDNLEDSSNHLFLMREPCNKIIIGEKDFESFLSKSKLIQ